MDLLNRLARVIGLVAVLALPTMATAEQAQLDTPSLINALKEGGYVIYFRHGITEHKEIDKAKIDVNEHATRNNTQNCATQRNLSTEGREKAHSMGLAIAALKIPIGGVYSSPFCRCVDTAWNLSLGRQPTISNSLYFAAKETAQGKARLGGLLQQMLATPPEQGKNTILVSHTSNLKEAVNLWPKPEGVAFIFKPSASGEAGFVGKILPDQWQVFSQVL